MRYLAAATVLLLVATSNGYPYFQVAIPNGPNVPNPCEIEGVFGTIWNGVGHRANAGAGPRNPFGLDFAENNFVWDECLCKHDSDGDGKTNGEELGDPDCMWSAGDVHPNSAGISHPGICEPLDSTECRDKNFWLDCQLMVPFECPAFEASDTRSFDLRIDATPVPAVETSYVCTTFTFDDEIAAGDFHMIGAETLPGNEAILHHLIVYGCPDTAAANVTDLYGETTECGDMVTEFCDEIIYIWAVGVSPDCFGDEYGVRLGQQGFKTVVVEFHWNNPEQLSGETDESGVRLYYTAELREFDAETIFIGPLYLELPPGQERVEQVSTCPGECTRYMFDQPVFISQIIPHMHTTGSEMVVELIRDGRVIQTLIQEDNYDYNYPKAKKFKPHVQVMPGDSIKVNCTFDTTDRDEFTFWGDSTSDEMCIAITQYYPKRPNATNCWGFESEHANIGNCNDFTYNETLLHDCYSYFDPANDDGFVQLFTAILEAYDAMGRTCDLTGRTCMPGCEAVIDKLRENECFHKMVDGVTKSNLLPFVTSTSQESPDIPDIDLKTFIQAMVSCDERHGNSDDDVDGDNNGGCVFEPPPPPSTASGAVLSLCAVLTAAVFAMLF